MRENYSLNFNETYTDGKVFAHRCAESNLCMLIWSVFWYKSNNGTNYKNSIMWELLYLKLSEVEERGVLKKLRLVW